VKIAKIVLLLAAGIIFITPLFLPDLFYGRREEIIEGAKTLLPKSSPTPTPSSTSREEFLSEISALISGQTAQFGIEVLELNSGDRFGINQDQKFHAASTGKVLVAVYALKRVDEKKLNLDQILEGVPLKERLRLMINISDNNSWEVLLKTLGYSKIQKFGEEQGLLGSDIYQNTTTAHDLNTLLSKLYKRGILSAESTDLLFSWMQNTEREERIPAAVPEGVAVYHKAGTLGGLAHDAAIIVHPRDPFTLVILSDGKEDRTQVFRQITQKVYQFEDQR
jgi:beta-lactamase class A